MPERLTHEAATRRGWVPAIVQAGIIVAVFAVGRCRRGRRVGVAVDPADGGGGRPRVAAGPGGAAGRVLRHRLYVVVASVAGLLIGALCGVFLDRAELVTLVAVLVGAALAGWVMVQVGHALGPPDPRELAETARNGTRFPSDLRIVGKSPYVAFPAGATLGLTVVLLGMTKRLARLSAPGAS